MKEIKPCFFRFRLIYLKKVYEGVEELTDLESFDLHDRYSTLASISILPCLPPL